MGGAHPSRPPPHAPRAGQVRVADNPSGGGTMSITTPTYVYELRSKDGPCLHRWQRKLNELFPQLGVTVHAHQKAIMTGTRQLIDAFARKQRAAAMVDGTSQSPMAWMAWHPAAGHSSSPG